MFQTFQRRRSTLVFKCASIKPYEWGIHNHVYLDLTELWGRNTSLCKTTHAKRIQRVCDWKGRNQQVEQNTFRSSSKVQDNFCGCCAVFWQVLSRHSGVRDQILCPERLHATKRGDWTVSGNCVQQIAFVAKGALFEYWIILASKACTAINPLCKVIFPCWRLTTYRYPPIFSPDGICSLGEDRTTQSIGPNAPRLWRGRTRSAGSFERFRGVLKIHRCHAQCLSLLHVSVCLGLSWPLRWNQCGTL